MSAAVVIVAIGLVFQNASALLIATLILVVLVVVIVAEEWTPTPDLTATVEPQ